MEKQQTYQTLHYRGPRKRKGVKNTFNEIMSENLPNLKKETDIQDIQELGSVSNKIYQKIQTKTYHC